jgi:hypothetical protein
MKKLISFIFLTNCLKQTQSYQLYEPNIQLQLTNIQRNETHIIANYEVDLYDATSNFPFNLDGKLNLSFFDLTVEGEMQARYTHRFKTATKEWQKKGQKLTLFNDMYHNLEPLGFVSGEQVDFDNVLKEIFDCWGPIEQYVSRIFSYNKISDLGVVTVQINKQKHIGILKAIELYWSISKSDSTNLDNVENFAEFMKECNSMPLNYLLLLLIFGAAILVFVGHFTHELIVLIVNSIRKYRRRNRVIDISRTFLR